MYCAVHLELITSLPTDGFMLGWKRFVAKHGWPKVIYSDTGTNFLRTENLLKSLNWAKIAPFKNSVDVQFSYGCLVGQMVGASDSDGKEIV